MTKPEADERDQRPRRINQILTLAGITSRRKADDLIQSGRVSVNGRVVTELGFRAIWGQDHILVDDRDIPKPFKRIYLMMNKPFGTMSTLSDPAGRVLVTDLVKGVDQRVYPVGRLDFDTMGLLLLTNDGEWANRLAHPRYRIPRTYKATVSGRVSDGAITRLQAGVTLDEGRCAPARVTLIARSERQSVLRVTISEGKRRQVRRMLEAVGYRVVHLIRSDFGGLTLGDLKVGQYRHLTDEELDSLKKRVNLE